MDPERRETASYFLLEEWPRGIGSPSAESASTSAQQMFEVAGKSAMLLIFTPI
jgi:hypothetical protein